MPQRKRATRAAPIATSVLVTLPKPRNAALKAAAQRQINLASRKHEKSKGAQRRSQKVALRKNTYDVL